MRMHVARKLLRQGFGVRDDNDMVGVVQRKDHEVSIALCS